MPAETAHHFTLRALSILLKVPGMKAFIKSLFYIERPVQFVGLRFPNRVGLAAGFDKNAKYLHELQALGFGFVEIGTVTPLGQPGNDQPRLFRLKKDEAIINRMGFNNDGADMVAARLKRRPAKLIVGGNIGKNKVTPNEEAQRDYEICFGKLYDHVDYFVVNVSSPNTPNLRALQDKEPLKKILSSLMHMRKDFIQQGKVRRPILLKIAPDLTEAQLDDVISIVQETGIDGLVATNTTISREGLLAPGQEVEQIGAGGLSGKILAKRSTEVVRYIHTHSSGNIPVIGVGGIDSVKAAQEKLEAGAALLQLYTGFIYKGPALTRQIVKHT